MTKRYQLFAIGNALVDTEIEVSDAFLQRMDVGKGMMTLVDEARQHELVTAFANEGVKHKRASGGSACNTVVAARYFGASTYYTCKVSDDETGQFFVQDLTAAGVDTNMSGPRPNGVSGKCLVMITPDAERTMNTYLGISETVSVDELDEEAIKQSEYVYLEGYLVTSETGRAAAIRLRELAEQHGIRTALTFSDPAMANFFRDGLAEMIGDGVDLLFCNKEEALLYTGKDNLDDAVEALMAVCRSLVVTLGAEGALLWDGSTLHQVEPVAVKAVDTNGAGDMFAGAFIYAITAGHSFADAGKLASAASARVVSDFGPRLAAQEHTDIRNAVLPKRG
ncbi:MAG: adenosine kinase [Gammaproteobacteria bacterium]|nr:adenosine kinase [Gammaproteobacteria bacterium]MBQ0774675.1 adenosine kinase [Gammaproteobacteria bacterium]